MSEVLLETERLILRKLEQDDFGEVYSIIRDTNVASQNVARRNGMVEVDTLVKHYRGVEMPHIVFRASRKNIKKVP